MSRSLNKCMLIGHLGRDPEIRQTKDGRAIASLSVATSESWKDKNSGERKEATEWHRVTIFNENIAKVAEQYLKKGSMVYLEGQLKTRKYTDKDGVERYSTEIVLQNFNGTLTMLDSKKSDAGAHSQEDYGTQKTAGEGARAYARDLDDEVPFAAEFR